MNVVTLIGNLATEVELKSLGEDKQVANFLLAVDRSGRVGEVPISNLGTPTACGGASVPPRSVHVPDPRIGQSEQVEERTERHARGDQGSRRGEA